MEWYSSGSEIKGVFIKQIVKMSKVKTNGGDSAQDEVNIVKSFHCTHNFLSYFVCRLYQSWIKMYLVAFPLLFCMCIGLDQTVKDKCITVGP